MYNVKFDYVVVWPEGAGGHFIINLIINPIKPPYYFDIQPMNANSLIKPPEGSINEWNHSNKLWNVIDHPESGPDYLLDDLKHFSESDTTFFKSHRLPIKAKQHYQFYSDEFIAVYPTVDDQIFVNILGKIKQSLVTSWNTYSVHELLHFVVHKEKLLITPSEYNKLINMIFDSTNINLENTYMSWKFMYSSDDITLKGLQDFCSIKLGQMNEYYKEFNNIDIREYFKDSAKHITLVDYNDFFFNLNVPVTGSLNKINYLDDFESIFIYSMNNLYILANYLLLFNEELQLYLKQKITDKFNALIAAGSTKRITQAEDVMSLSNMVKGIISSWEDK